MNILKDPKQWEHKHKKLHIILPKSTYKKSFENQ